MSHQNRIGEDTPPAQNRRIEWAASLQEHMDEHHPPMTRKELLAALQARGVNVSRQSVDYWLAGKTAPSDDNRYHLAKVLGVPIHRLFPIEMAS